MDRLRYILNDNGLMVLIGDKVPWMLNLCSYINPVELDDNGYLRVNLRYKNKLFYDYIDTLYLALNDLSYLTDLCKLGFRYSSHNLAASYIDNYLRKRMFEIINVVRDINITNKYLFVKK